MGLFSIKQLAAGWILTNIFYLLSSSSSFLTLEYVRQISLGQFLLIWLGFHLVLCLPQSRFLPRKIPSIIPCAGICLAVIAAGAARNAGLL